MYSVSVLKNLVAVYNLEIHKIIAFLPMKSEFKVKTFHRSISLFNRDHLVVKIYEAVVNKSNFFQKKPVVTRQFEIKCSFLVPAHEKQQQKARAHAVWCKNALCAGSHCACPQTKWRNVSYL